jgi:hypothetical protein
MGGMIEIAPEESADASAISKKKKQNVRNTFPKVYKLAESRNGKPYWLVDARSKKWGTNERPTFSTEKEALDRARAIAKQVEKSGAQAELPKEKSAMADAYTKLADRLISYSKTPENATGFYLAYLGSEAIRQAQPSLMELVDEWQNEKLTSKIKPLAERTKTELKQYARHLRRKWGDQKTDDVTRRMVEDALNGLPVNNRNTHRKYLRYIRMFFIWAKDNQHLTRENPTQGI